MSRNEITPDQARTLLPKARKAAKRAQERFLAGTGSEKNFHQLLDWEETLEIIGSRNRGVIEHMTYMSKRNPGRSASKPQAMRLVEKCLGRKNPVLTNPKRKLTQEQKRTRALKNIRRSGRGGVGKKLRRLRKWAKVVVDKKHESFAHSPRFWRALKRDTKKQGRTDWFGSVMRHDKSRR